jgi:hypothetical protein
MNNFPEFGTIEFREKRISVYIGKDSCQIDSSAQGEGMDEQSFPPNHKQFF